MADQVYELNVTGARIAKEVASSFTDRPRWVIGSIGPGTKLPSLGHATFDELEASYEEQSRGLVDGGADVLIIETCQDMLQVKTAVAGAVAAFERTGKKLPLIVQVTIETTGTMLLGTEIAAALTALEPFGAIDVIGVNCATGPVEMTEHVRFLCQSSRKFVSVLPNAGLPELRHGKPYYPLSPEEFVRHHTVFVKEFGTNIAGGCCGTTPEHIKLLADALGGTDAEGSVRRVAGARQRVAVHRPAVPPGHLVPRDRRAMQRPGIPQVQGARRERGLRRDGSCREGADARGRARARRVGRLHRPRRRRRHGASSISRFRTQVTLPLVLDSTEPQVIEAGAQAARRPVGDQLDQPRGGDRRRLAAHAKPAPGEEVRRGVRRAGDRRAGPGDDQGLEARGLQAARRYRARAGRAAAAGLDLRRARVPDHDRHGGAAARRRSRRWRRSRRSRKRSPARSRRSASRTSRSACPRPRARC